VSLFLLRFLPEVRGQEGKPHASPAMGESPPLA
jgi:hypothetical protein